MTDLRDLRAKVTPLAWAWLEAESRATGADQSQIVREILQGWAERKQHAATVAARLMRSEGIVGNEGNP